MKTLLYNKPSLQSVWAFVLVKSGTIFTKITGYDLMFESSRKDIKMSELMCTDIRHSGEDVHGPKISWPR